MNIWSVTDVIAVGDKLVLANGHGWEPFVDAEELEHVSNNTFKVAKASSFSSINEPVEFKTDTAGKVREVIYAGGSLLPEESYLKEFSKKKIIGQ